MKELQELIGIYQASGRGFGFLIPEEGEDCFVPPRANGGAWNGDKVAASVIEEDRSAGRRVAKVTQVLERANKTVTGVLERKDHTLWLRPDNDKLPGPIQVFTKRKGVRAGERAAVAMTSFGGGKTAPMGTLRERFGPADRRESAVEAILYTHDIERAFPPAVLAEVERVPQAVEPSALAGRLDLRDKTIITIDGASSKDFDDAVSLERDGQGRWVLGVHIADVSHYVREGSQLDLEAFERGTSVYFADQVVPMLPVELSNGICSLNPQVDRLALSCVLTLSPDGTVADYTIQKSVICSAERMTYEDCNVLLAGEDPALAERYAHILPMLQDMAALAKVLERRRKSRGALDLETRESYVICDGEGKPVAVALRQQGESEKLIESFMLAANECVAEHLNKLQKPCVYRVHEKPSNDKSEALRTLVAPLGYDLKETDSHALQKLLDWAKGRPEEGAVSMMVLRSLMKARYDGQNLGHFGLAAPYYCHFTSPIRRYPDLMVHRILTALLDGTLDRQEKKLTAAVQRAAVHSSQRELAAQEAEREIEKRYLAEFMAGHVGEIFAGVVTGVTRFGLFVSVAGGVEGLLPAEALPGGPWHFDEAHLTLLEDNGSGRYTFGMALEVECAAADPVNGQVDFILPGGTPVPQRERPREKEQTEQPRRKGGKRRAMHVPKRRKGGRKR